MASLGAVEAELGGLPADLKRALLSAWRYFGLNLRFGPVEHQAKAENFQGYTLTSTTASSTGEFSVLHGLGRAPYRAMPCADLSAVGAQIVPLEVTRAADAQRIYLKSTSTSAVFSLYVE